MGYWININSSSDNRYYMDNKWIIENYIQFPDKGMILLHVFYFKKALKFLSN